MKVLFTLLSLVFLVSSCTLTEKPVFVNIENIDVDKVSNQEIHIKAQAVFENKNDIGGKLVADNIDVFINDILVGQIKASEFDVPSKNTFKIPLEGTFSAAKLLETNTNDLLNSLLKFIQAKKIPVQFRGNIVFKKGFLSHTYLIDRTEEILIKL